MTCDRSVVFSGSSTNKTDRHDITEILLKMALNKQTLCKHPSYTRIKHHKVALSTTDIQQHKVALSITDIQQHKVELSTTDIQHMVALSTTDIQHMVALNITDIQQHMVA